MLESVCLRWQAELEEVVVEVDPLLELGLLVAVDELPVGEEEEELFLLLREGQQLELTNAPQTLTLRQVGAWVLVILTLVQLAQGLPF